MSIIYDALKKVEQSSAKNLETKVTKGSAPSSRIPKFLIYVLVVCFGFFIANFFFGMLPKQLSDNNLLKTKNPPQIQKSAKETPPQVKPPLPVETKAEPKKELSGSFVLNGVFFSGNEGYALINNRIVKKGDIIDGATVALIALNEVDLEKEGAVIKLSNNPR